MKHSGDGEPALDRIAPVIGTHKDGDQYPMAEQVVQMAAKGLFGPAAKAIAQIGPKPFDMGEESRDPESVANVIVGHWLVSGETRRSRMKKHETMRGCTSKCGLLVWYPDWKIRGGKLPATCWACRKERMQRSGFSPGEQAGCVVLSEENVKLLQPLWESPVNGTYSSKLLKSADVTSNLKAGDAVKDWQADGLAILCKVLSMTPWGDTFGWKAHVRDCHTAPEKKGKEQVHVGRVEDGHKFVTVVVHPKESVYVFDVDVRAVRTDVPFRTVADEIRKAVAVYTAPAGAGGGEHAAEGAGVDGGRARRSQPVAPDAGQPGPPAGGREGAQRRRGDQGRGPEDGRVRPRGRA